MAMLGYVCCKYPDSQLSIIFLPMFTFSASSVSGDTSLRYIIYPAKDYNFFLYSYLYFSCMRITKKALKAIMAVDAVGCVLRWTFFDHAAHLGGALFGL